MKKFKITLKKKKPDTPKKGRGGARRGAGRPKKTKMPAGRPTNPDESDIRGACTLIDAVLPTMIEVLIMAAKGKFLDKHGNVNKKIKVSVTNRIRAASEILGKRIPTATGITDLGIPVKDFTDEELAGMSEEELGKELMDARNADSR